jgi:hypothetical protein
MGLSVVVEGEEALEIGQVLLGRAHRLIGVDSHPGAPLVDATPLEGARLLVEALIGLVKAFDVGVVAGLLAAAQLQGDAELFEQHESACRHRSSRGRT